MTLAGGIAAALLQRERTGRGPVVDVSLLAAAMWSISAGVVAVGANGLDDPLRVPREENLNPLSVTYRTKDGRFLKLSLLQSERYFTEFCDRLDASDLRCDPRFTDASARAEHRSECVAALDELFERFSLDEVRSRLTGFDGPWAVVQRSKDLFEDPQVEANGYLADVAASDGSTFQIVAPPVQFDEERVSGLKPCPGHGEHTDEILLELGFSAEETLDRKIAGAVL
jgi:crotonobetainyl-CoA:carnitine CoA-transferase CaiB-like acyl-CoA transferase